MKKVMSLLVLVVIALLCVPGTLFAQEVVAVTPDQTFGDGSIVAKLVAAVCAMAVPLICSVCANFFEVKEDDKAWLKSLKKICNTFAVNLSHKAGK